MSTMLHSLYWKIVKVEQFYCYTGRVKTICLWGICTGTAVPKSNLVVLIEINNVFYIFCLPARPVCPSLRKIQKVVQQNRHRRGEMYWVWLNVAKSTPLVGEQNTRCDRGILWLMSYTMWQWRVMSEMHIQKHVWITETYVEWENREREISQHNTIYA